jgi:protein SCO1/2
MVAAIELFFVSWRFAVFALCVLLGIVGLLAVLLWLPPAPAGLGAFAEQFRVWCFGTGSGQTVSPVLEGAMVLELLSLAVLIALVWAGPIAQQAAASARAFVPYVAAGLTVVAAFAGGLWWLGRAPVDPTVFPALELRTRFPPPALALTNHEGRPVSLDELKGRVVVVTAVYATCGFACPRILGQAKRVVQSLDGADAAGVTVLGVTLDPEHDDVETLAHMAAAQGVKAPRFQLLTGESAEVEKVLDRMGVERRRDPDTGVIDHADLFLVIDRAGFVAYRFTVSDLQERWMREALLLLLREPQPGKTALLEPAPGER